MKPDLSSYGGRLLDLGFAGQVADLQPSEIVSKVNDGAAAIDFGIAVVRGASDDTVKVQAADIDKIIGISVRYPIRPADATGDTKYAQRDALPVMRKGNIMVLALENTNDGDVAVAVVAQGGKIGSVTGGAVGAGRIAIPGAVWETTTTAGQIGIVRING